ncbi:MAG: 2-hydroxyacyl-CoA dehydratase family protein [Candidatus Helarchaeota archaeon]
MKAHYINNLVSDFTLQSILDLGIKYLLGNKEIQALKRSGKKIIGSFLPPLDMIYSFNNTLPIFLPRLIEFEYEKYVPVLNLINKFGLLNNIIEYYLKNSNSIMDLFFRNFDQSGYSRVFSGLIDLAANSNYYMDTCVQTRISYGAFIKYFNLVDMVIGGFEGNYCLHFAKFYERLNIYKPTFYFEKPYGNQNIDHTAKIISEEFDRFILYVEKTIEQKFNDEKLIEILELQQKIRKYLALIHRLFMKGYVPLHAAALTLIHGCYVDLLSDPLFCKNKIKQLTEEIYRKYKDNELYNYRKEGIPRVIIAGSPGFDPALPSIFENAGAAFLYLDLFQSAKESKFKINKNMDGTELYKKYLIETNFVNGIIDLIDLWLNLARDIKADGILFSKSWGCRFTTPAFKILKDRALSELSIPVLGLDFYSPGENLGQVKTRVEAFIEMIK